MSSLTREQSTRRRRVSDADSMCDTNWWVSYAVVTSWSLYAHLETTLQQLLKYHALISGASRDGTDEHERLMDKS